MRVAYAGYDFFSSCLRTLIQRPDTEVALCLTGRTGETVDDIVRQCQTAQIPLLFGRPGPDAVQVINRLGIDIFVSAAYSYRVPVELLSIGMAINVHPSLLPDGRGPNPLPYLLDPPGRSHCGVSIHEMSREFDSGPILRQTNLELAESDGFDELALRLYALAPLVLNQFLDNYDSDVAKKTVQGAGSYWADQSDLNKSLQVSDASVHDVVAKHRQFGALGIRLILANGSRVNATRIVAVACEHPYVAGKVVARQKTGWIIAAIDGLVKVLDPVPDDGGEAGGSSPTAKDL